MGPVSYVIGAGAAIAVFYWPRKAQTPLQDDESMALEAFTVQQAQTAQTRAGWHLSVVGSEISVPCMHPKTEATHVWAAENR